MLNRSSENIFNPLLGTKRGQSAEGVLVERREAPSTCMYGIRWQLIKSLEVVAEISDTTQFSYFYVMNSFLKLPSPTRNMTLFDDLYLGQYYV